MKSAIEIADKILETQSYTFVEPRDAGDAMKLLAQEVKRLTEENAKVRDTANEAAKSHIRRLEDLNERDIVLREADYLFHWILTRTERIHVLNESDSDFDPEKKIKMWSIKYGSKN